METRLLRNTLKKTERNGKWNRMLTTLDDTLTTFSADIVQNFFVNENVKWFQNHGTFITKTNGNDHSSMVGLKELKTRKSSCVIARHTTRCAASTRHAVPVGGTPRPNLGPGWRGGIPSSPVKGVPPILIWHGVPPSWPWKGVPPSRCGQTDACENITFPIPSECRR